MTKSTDDEIQARVQRLIGDPLLTVKEVSAYIRLSVSAIYRLLVVGSFPRPLSVGLKKKMWRQSAIDGWLAEQNPGTEKREA